MILPATFFDAEQLALTMRQSDVEEWRWMSDWHGHPETPPVVATLAVCVIRGNTWSVWDRNAYLGMIGVVRTETGAGVIWFLGTDEADRRPVALTRECRRFAVSQARLHEWLGNVIPPHFSGRKRWLEAIGFDFEPNDDNDAAKPLVFSWRRSAREPEVRPL